jgi:hypothetical protein
MWIATNQGFFSVVASDQDPTVLMVRARFRDDLRRAFDPLLKRLGLEVFHSPDRDYAYRCFIPRDEFAREIARRLLETDYTNFKDSVNGENIQNLKALYDDIWFCGAQAQDMDQERSAGGDALLRNLVPGTDTVSVGHG